MKRKVLEKIVVSSAMFAMGAISTLGRVNANVFAGVTIDSSNFPDAVFREYILEEFDINGNGSLSQEEVDNVKYIDAPSDTSDIKGVELFQNLTGLSARKCKNLESISISGMQNLQELDCSGSGIMYANINGCPNLELIDLTYCGLACADIYNINDYIEAFTYLSDQYIEMEAMEINGEYVLDFNQIQGFNFEKATFDMLYLDGAVIEDGVVKWKSLDDMSKKIYYTYDCGVEEMEIEVSVKEPPVKVTSVNANVKKIVLRYSEKIKIVPSVLPSDATNKNLLYTYGDDIVESANGVTLTGEEPGTKYLYIKTLDGTEIKTKVKVVVKSRKESKVDTKWKAGRGRIEIYKYTGNKIKFMYLYSSAYSGKVVTFTKTCKLYKGKGSFTYKDDRGNKGKGTIWVKKNNVYLKCTQTKYNENADYSVGTFKKTKFKYKGVLE